MSIADGKKLGGRYLSFVLGENTYAIPVGKVEVVLEMQPITRVPNAQKNICGVINHRGSVVPVIDLRVTFAAESKDSIESVSIVVLQVEFEGTLMSFGMLADGVREVIDLDDTTIESIPEIAKGKRKQDGEGSDRFVQAIARLADEFIILVDMDAVFQEVSA
ncbi:MAG: chemotaxis protein CheW [Spirochaetes bacterium]|nr:chemotaxis protein CheW [Spirochaetota bacterium]MBU0955134.1 chemotaxis protein CheW [Spirochaetota bacterium]